jgi:hypothetical protein
VEHVIIVNVPKPNIAQRSQNALSLLPKPGWEKALIARYTAATVATTVKNKKKKVCSRHFPNAHIQQVKREQLVKTDITKQQQNKRTQEERYCAF